MVAVSGSTTPFNFIMDGGGTSDLIGQLSNSQLVEDYSTKQYYDLLALALSGSKQVSAMELTSGPNAVAPQDFTTCDWGPTLPFCGYINLVGNTPKVGDAYDIKLTYSDGTSETKTYTLASVPGSFGADPSPSGIGANLTPTISWTDPPNAGDYNYTFSFSGGSPSETWDIPAQDYGLSFSSSIDSLTWGTDPTGGGNVPSPASLSATGGSYNWEVMAKDSNGNFSNLDVGYYLGWNHVMLPAPNAATLGAATVGQVYSGTITVSNGTAPYDFVVTGLSDGLTYSSNGGTLTIAGTPIAAGAITFNVFVIDSTTYSWGPVPYTITVNN